MTNTFELETRAIKAYLVAAKKQSDGMGQPLQPKTPPDVITIDDKQYIVLSNINGILAVYRVRTVNGASVLKSLKRYPKEIVERFA